MKKTALLVMAGIVLVAAANAQVSYGLKAGANFAKMAMSDGNDSESSSSTTSFHLTGFAEIPAAPNFAIQPGLSLQGKGGKGAVDGITFNIMSVEVPVNAVYYIPTGPAVRLFLGAGPYLGVNISGTTEADGDKRDIEFGSEDDQIGRIDYGINLMAGFKLAGGFLVNAGYGMGLGNLLNMPQGSDFDLKARNSVLSVGVGFAF